MPPPVLVPPIPVVGVVEPIVVVPFTARCWSALFCDDELVPLREVLLLWNMFCSTVNACCGSPFFIWKT